MDIMTFVSENMYIVVTVLYVFGMFLKAIPKIPDWLIPFILAALGVGLGIALIGAPDGILQGILCAGGAVLVNQCIKQSSDAIADSKQAKAAAACGEGADGETTKEE